MIHSFSCKNFYSFAEQNSVSFVVNEKAPKNNGYFTSPSNFRLSKAEVIIGPNASGKTNLLKVLPFLKWLIIDSFSINPSAPIPVKPFLFTTGKNMPIDLSVTFEIEGNVYIYTFTLNEQKILNETLKVKNKTKQKLTEKTLFDRKWDVRNQKYVFNSSKFDLPKKFEELLRTNASVVGTAMRLNHEMSQKIGEYWQGVQTNVVEAGWIGDQFLPNANINLIHALNFYSENKVLKKEAEKLLARFDLGLNAFDIKKEKKADGFSINVKGIHNLNSREYPLAFQYESAGTKQLFILLKSILQVLSHGGIAILDELDVNLHPDMIMALVEMFISSETNPKNAQIIFSSHNHSILGELDKYQIILTEKNKQGSSEVWRLDEMSGVRADDNYYTKYIAGTYGAVPQID